MAIRTIKQLKIEIWFLFETLYAKRMFFPLEKIIIIKNGIVRKVVRIKKKYDRTIGLKTKTTGVERQIFGTTKNCLQKLHYSNFLLTSYTSKIISNRLVNCISKRLNNLYWKRAAPLSRMNGKARTSITIVEKCGSHDFTWRYIKLSYNVWC